MSPTISAILLTSARMTVCRASPAVLDLPRAANQANTAPDAMLMNPPSSADSAPWCPCQTHAANAAGRVITTIHFCTYRNAPPLPGCATRFIRRKTPEIIRWPSMPRQKLDDAIFAQPRDLGVTHAERVAQHLVGMLTQY